MISYFFYYSATENDPVLGENLKQIPVNQDYSMDESFLFKRRFWPNLKIKFPNEFTQAKRWKFVASFTSRLIVREIIIKKFVNRV